MKGISAIRAAALLLTCGLTGLWADSATGTLFYTTFAGGQNVWKVNYNFNGSTFVLSGNTNVASTNGADGLLFAPDGNLIVAGQGNTLTEVTTGGTTVKTVAPGNPAFHLALNSNASNALLYSVANGSGAQIGATQLSSGGLNAGGVAYTTSLAAGKVGSTDVRGLIFDPTNNTWYYGTAGDGSTSGDFGTVAFNDTTHTATLTPLLHGVAAHGLTFDPFTNDIIFSSGNEVEQFDPTSGTVIGTLTATGQFDQSAVDGKGHLFVASNFGNLFFVDYDATKNISSATFSANPFLASNLDDIAPIAGIGGGGQGSVPEPSSILLFGTVLAGAVYKLRKRTA